MRRKITKDPQKRDITIGINNTLANARARLATIISETYNKDLRDKHLVSSEHMIREYTRILLEDPQDHVDESLMLAEELVCVLLAGALLVQMKYLDKINPDLIPMAEKEE